MLKLVSDIKCHKIDIWVFQKNLCRIEEQCVAEHFNHAQRTRVFDLLAGWISVQRNSLYIRMKAQKDKREVIDFMNVRFSTTQKDCCGFFSIP